MALKRCLDCPRLTSSPRCPECTRAKDQQRGTTTQRGYGTEHQAIRVQLLATYQPSEPCRRCTLPLGPDPSVLDLGHPTDGYAGYALEHKDCNRGKRRRPP
jgi:hypothetical protein